MPAVKRYSRWEKLGYKGNFLLEQKLSLQMEELHKDAMFAFQEMTSPAVALDTKLFNKPPSPRVLRLPTDNVGLTGAIIEPCLQEVRKIKQV